MSTKKEIWRLLEDGEKILEGDQYFNKGGEPWMLVEDYDVGDTIDSSSVPFRRRMTLPEHQGIEYGWQNVTSESPTAEEANAQGDVLWLRKGTMDKIVGYWNSIPYRTSSTHWMMIPNDPEEPKDPDDEAWGKVKQEMIASNPGLGNATVHWGLIEDAFKRGRKSAATESEAP